MKVFIQYPWKVKDSSYYKYLVEFPPKNVTYINGKREFGITEEKKFIISNKTKRIIRKIIETLKIPDPNAHYTFHNMDFDLIHCAHCLSLNRKDPWVADIEAAWNFWISGNPTTIGKLMVKKILLRKNCKKIMPWTNATKKEILKIFPEKTIRNKIEVVYPALPVQKFKRKNKRKVTILYATRYFWLKGGLIALETCRKIKEKYGDNVEIIFISNVPQNIKRKYKMINIKDIVSQEKLFEYYKMADIFFYPSFFDTFGFALLEAMSFGLPIISINTPDTPAIKEIVQNFKQGLVLDVKHSLVNRFSKLNYQVYNILRKEKKIINTLFVYCSNLIENKNFRNIMSKNCINEISRGKFSIKKRNIKLRNIYEDAISIKDKTVFKQKVC